MSNPTKKYGKKLNSSPLLPQPDSFYSQAQQQQQQSKSTLLSYYSPVKLFNDPIPSILKTNTDPIIYPKNSSGQLYFRLGQKEKFLTECKICFMAYNPSSFEDQRIHAKYHKSHLIG